MQSLFFIILGIFVAAIVCQFLGNRYGRYIALSLACALGIIAFQVAQKPQRIIIMATPNEDLGRKHYSQGETFLQAGKIEQAVQQFELAQENFVPGSGLDKAARAAILYAKSRGV